MNTTKLIEEIKNTDTLDGRLALVLAVEDDGKTLIAFNTDDGKLVKNRVISDDTLASYCNAKDRSTVKALIPRVIASALRIDAATLPDSYKAEAQDAYQVALDKMVTIINKQRALDSIPLAKRKQLPIGQQQMITSALNRSSSLFRQASIYGHTKSELLKLAYQLGKSQRDLINDVKEATSSPAIKAGKGKKAVEAAIGHVMEFTQPDTVNAMALNMSKFSDALGKGDDLTDPENVYQYTFPSCLKGGSRESVLQDINEVETLDAMDSLLATLEAMPEEEIEEIEEEV